MTRSEEATTEVMAIAATTPSERPPFCDAAELFIWEDGAFMPAVPDANEGGSELLV